MKKKRSLLLIILGSVLVLCVICGVIVAVSPKSDATPTVNPNRAELGQQPGNETTGTSQSQQPSATVVEPSNTPEPSHTPTATSTFTPVPPATQTAQAVADKQTQVAQAATSTRQSLYDQQTATVEAQNATKTQAAAYKTATADTLNANRTATAAVRSAQVTKIAQYVIVPWKDLVTYPDHYTGQKVKVSGQIFNINGDTELQMWIGNMEAVYVVMEEPFSGIYEDSWVIVYGTVSGTNCGTNAFGGEVCQPLLTDAFYTIP